MTCPQYDVDQKDVKIPLRFPTTIAILPPMTDLQVKVSTWDKNYIELQDRSENVIWISANDVEEVCKLLRNLANKIKKDQ